MQRYARSHLSDPSLLQSAATHAGRERTSSADLLADIAEIDARKLYVPAGYPSLFAYCVGELRLSGDAAARRIQAARAACRFPAIFHAVAEGWLHLTAVGLLAPHLTEGTADELLASATHKSKSEIEQLLAARFPKSDVLAWVEVPSPSSVPRSDAEHALAHVEDEHALAHVQAQRAPGHVVRSRVKPLSSESFAVQFTLSRGAHDKLRYMQELLSHQVPSGDIAEIFERTLDIAIAHVEKRKFAATTRPRAGQRASTRSTRHIPAPVRRTVWARDGGQCTFVSEAGHRCEARELLQFDHIVEFARGGEATVAGIRLRCRPHNQYAAECTFGTEFMRHKRQAAAEARAAAKLRAAAAARAPAAAAAQAPGETFGEAPGEGEDRDVVPWLRQLGFSARESREAAALCRDMPDNGPLGERVRVALSYFRPRGTRAVRPAGGFGTAVPRAGVGAVAAGP